MKTPLKIKNSRFKIVAALILILGGSFFEISCKGSGQTGQDKKAATIYTCVMHHQIHRDKPGDCPICGMTLVPLSQIEATPGLAAATDAFPPEKKIRYWANPMHPEQHSDKPMKDEMGMDYVPVYEQGPTSPPTGTGAPPEIASLAPVHITPYKAQLIDVKFAKVEKKPITRVIRTIGRFAGGEGDFAALAGDFAAEKPLKPSGRYVVADVYALDLPFVKVGQKAFIGVLGGSGGRVEGKVSYIFPYDQTQSRVTRVKISLVGAAPSGIFANVDIEAVTQPKLEVPSTAVMDTGTRSYVFVQTADGTFTPVVITTGFEGENEWEVTSGLKEGDQVVDGALYLIDADSKLNATFTESN